MGDRAKREAKSVSSLPLLQLMGSSQTLLVSPRMALEHLGMMEMARFPLVTDLSIPLCPSSHLEHTERGGAWPGSGGFWGLALHAATLVFGIAVPQS